MIEGDVVVDCEKQILNFGLVSCVLISLTQMITGVLCSDASIPGIHNLTVIHI